VKYFALPVLGTPYTRYYHLESTNTVIAVDISRPDGIEVTCPTGVKFKLRPVNYSRHPVHYGAADAARQEYIESRRRHVDATRAGKAKSARDKSSAVQPGGAP